MKWWPIIVIACGLLSSCATGNNATTMTSSKCVGHFLFSHSKLADELIKANATIDCSSFSDNGTHGQYLYTTAATTSRSSIMFPGEDIGDMTLYIQRFDRPTKLNSSFVPVFGPTERKPEYLPINEPVQVNLGASTVKGEIFAYLTWPGHIPYSCIYAATPDGVETPLRAILCRSTAIGTDNKTIIEWAKAQTADAFSSIRP